jgi:hypothetical protein
MRTSEPGTRTLMMRSYDLSSASRSRSRATSSSPLRTARASALRSARTCSRRQCCQGTFLVRVLPSMAAHERARLLVVLLALRRQVGEALLARLVQPVHCLIAPLRALRAHNRLLVAEAHLANLHAARRGARHTHTHARARFRCSGVRTEECEHQRQYTKAQSARTHSDVLRRFAHGVYTMCTLLSLLPWMLLAFTSWQQSSSSCAWRAWQSAGCCESLTLQATRLLGDVGHSFALGQAHVDVRRR